MSDDAARRRRRWQLLAVLLYGAVLGAVGYHFTHDTLLVQDSDILMEMTRSAWSRHSLEVPNGRDVSAGLDTWLKNTAIHDGRLYGKYPPIYAYIAAVPYAIAGVRAMYLLNAFGLAIVLLGYHLLACRLLDIRTATWSTIVVPFAVPLFPYATIELPHLLSAACMLFATLAFERSLGLDATSGAPRRSSGTFAWGLASGLLVGVATGIRLQSVISGGVLALLTLARARHRWAATSGNVLGQALLVAAIGFVNVGRFGSANPFSYGPRRHDIATPIDAETARYFVSSPWIVMALALPVLVIFAFRFRSRARPWQVATATAALAGLLAIPPLRQHLERMGESMVSLLVNGMAFGAGWNVASMTFGWINKPLLASAPVLVLGLIGMLVCATRRTHVLLEAGAWMTFVALVFLSLRNPDPRTDEGVSGFFSLSPRYLVDLMPFLFVTTCWMLRDVRLNAASTLAAAPSALAMLALFAWASVDDTDPRRTALLVWGSIVASMTIGLSWVVRRSRGAKPLLAFAATLGMMYTAIGCTLGDARAYARMGEQYERWVRELQNVTPHAFVLVGWGNARDPVFSVRERRDVVFVNAAVDTGAQLRETLGRFSSRGLPIYYFGLGMEQARPMIEPAYESVSVLDDPLLWRLDPRR